MNIESFHKTFNARHLAPKEVAESFIWSESFNKLLHNNHSIVLGARGCGKTTLMKMLTLPALYHWENDRAQKIRESIPFYGIYISTDIYWNVKNQTYGSQLESYGTFAEKISHFAVNSNVFTSLCDAFLNIINFELTENESAEIELSEELIKAWKLPATIPKIKFVKEALNERIDEVNQFVQEVIFNYKPQDDIPTADYYNLNFESSIETLIPKFERIFGIENKKKWALCFDELEFAPLWLQKKLFTSLRSRTQYLLYKLSSSPILPSILEKSVQVEYGPTSGNDLEIIKMWTSGDTEEFSSKLIASFLNGQIPETVFGTNPIYNKQGNSYEKESDFYKQVKELLEKDTAFRSFLETRNIDSNNLEIENPNFKDTIYRKIKPIVYFRNAFIENNTGTFRTLRSRKRPSELYFGIEVLSKIFDGNPRWLIGLMTQLKEKKDGRFINKADQYQELINVAKRFENVIANIPLGTSELTIVDLIDRISDFFNDQILGIHFNLDPKGTFVVDDVIAELYPGICDLIEKAVAQGAMIPVDSENEAFDFDVMGKRFKLSYLFSILKNLPLRSYSEIKLSKCLSGSEGDLPNQFTIFDQGQS